MNAIVEAYKAQVAAYHAKHGRNWAQWADAESVFDAIPFDWETLNDEEGEQFFSAVFDEVEAAKAEQQ